MPSLATAMVPLNMRSTASLGAKKLGTIPKGKRVYVLKVIVDQSGMVRAEIADQSDPAKAIGWVTSYKNGIEMLRVGSAAQLQGGFFTSSKAFYNSARQPSPPRGMYTLDEYYQRYESMGARLAGQQGGSRSKAKSPITSRARDWSSMQSSMSSGATLAKELADAVKNEAESSESSGEPRKKEKDKSTSLIKAAKLAKKAEELRAVAVNDETRDFATISTMLVELLAQKKKPVDELIREWDRNNDGGIDGKEFRICMRGLGGPLKDIDVREIDKFFATLDTEGTGDVSTSNLKKAIKKMQQDAEKRLADSIRARENAQRYNSIAVLFQTAADIMSDLEATEKMVHALTMNKSIDARLGEVLQKRNVRIGEVMTQWDKDGNGSVDKKEFVLHVKELGLRADVQEVKDLFDSLDEDGNGDLDIEELKVCLKTLQDAAIKVVEDVKTQKKKVVELRKAASAAQEKAQATLEEIEEATAAEEQAAREAAMARAVAEDQKYKAKLQAEREAKAARMAKVSAAHGMVGQPFS